MAVWFPDASCSEMFKSRRVHQCVSDRAAIIARIFDEPLLVDGFEFDLIEAGFETRLESQVKTDATISSLFVSIAYYTLFPPVGCLRPTAVVSY